MFPINRHCWEILVSIRDIARIYSCATDCGFAIEYYGSLRPGFFVRAQIVHRQSKVSRDKNPFLQEAAAIYSEYLQRYTRRQVLLDILGALYFVPRSVIMGFNVYRRHSLHFLSERQD